MQRLANIYLKNFVTWLLLFFGLSGCFSYQETKVNFSLQDPKPAKESKKVHVWIKLVSLPEFNHDTPKENLTAFVTYRLYKFLKESNQFEKVTIQYSKDLKLPSNSILLEFQFTKIVEKDKFHASFFPFSLVGWAATFATIQSNLGFVLYALFGGPHTANQMEYEGNLVAYSSTGKEIGKVPLKLYTEFNSNLLYYEKEIEANHKRKEMLELALQTLIQKGEWK